MIYFGAKGQFFLQKLLYQRTFLVVTWRPTFVFGMVNMSRSDGQPLKQQNKAQLKRKIWRTHDFHKKVCKMWLGWQNYVACTPCLVLLYPGAWDIINFQLPGAPMGGMGTDRTWITRPPHYSLPSPLPLLHYPLPSPLPLLHSIG